MEPRSEGEAGEERGREHGKRGKDSEGRGRKEGKGERIVKGEEEKRGKGRGGEPRGAERERRRQVPGRRSSRL